MFRFQGTDGVRRHVKLSDDPAIAGLAPQDAFMEHGVMTEQFMELYAYCRIKMLIDSGAMKAGDNFVVGWDPRDSVGTFNQAVVDGVLKAGANAINVDIAPTPLVVLYMQYLQAGGALVVTASHNPASYNGIKVFTRHGLKLLPGDDELLSDAVLNTEYENVQKLTRKGWEENHHKQAIELFESYSLDPRNSWIDDKSAMAHVFLIVDTANGALSETAGPTLHNAGFGEVVTVCNDYNSQINFNCGVSELEGVDTITPDMLTGTGRFSANEAVLLLFKTGRQRAEAIKSGDAMVSAAVFDGDGDRFYRVDYDPYTDTAHVLSGDETSILQARFRNNPDNEELFINSVESDLESARTAGALGYSTALTAVGDKWILQSAFLALLRQTAPEGMVRQIDESSNDGKPKADMIEEILSSGSTNVSAAGHTLNIIGAEESGHNITPGFLKNAAGDEMTVFHGNGLKSCLNTFAATETGPLLETATTENKFKIVSRPFKTGYKKTLYIYYVDKARWRRGSDAWREAEHAIRSHIKENWLNVTVEEMVHPGESNMLYLKVMEGGIHAGSLFIRNSGTEDKTGITLRGRRDDGQKLWSAGNAGFKRLLKYIKDPSSVMGRAEIALLKASIRGAPAEPVDELDERLYAQLLNEVGLKQGLLTSGQPGALLTESGKNYLSIVMGGQ